MYPIPASHRLGYGFSRTDRCGANDCGHIQGELEFRNLADSLIASSPDRCRLYRYDWRTNESWLSGIKLAIPGSNRGISRESMSRETFPDPTQGRGSVVPRNVPRREPREITTSGILGYRGKSPIEGFLTTFAAPSVTKSAYLEARGLPHR